MQLSEVSEACGSVTDIELEQRLIVFLFHADVDVSVRELVAPECDRAEPLGELTLVVCVQW